MLGVHKVVTNGHDLAPSVLRRANKLTLDWDVRQKSRFHAVDSAGRELAVVLPRGTQLRGGHLLVAEDGSLILVEAAPQQVLKITHCSSHGSRFDLMRAAYHLGNRHVAMELKPDHLKIEPDHVLADMLRAMHLIVHQVSEPFEPEGGAYGHGTHGAHGGHSHGHDEHDHSHTHDRQEHTHNHSHYSHSHSHSHVHD
jgi:urease accessory protein